MNFFKKIYQKLLDLFFDKKDNSFLKEKTKHIASLDFKILDKTNLDIVCQLPDIDSLSAEDIVDMAELYAQLIVKINNGLFKTEIFKIMKSTYENNSNIEYKLLADNILYFCEILQIEYDKYKESQNNSIIKPTSVFKVK